MKIRSSLVLYSSITYLSSIPPSTEISLVNHLLPSPYSVEISGYQAFFISVSVRAIILYHFHIQRRLHHSICSILSVFLGQSIMTHQAYSIISVFCSEFHHSSFTISTFGETGSSCIFYHLKLVRHHSFTYLSLTLRLYGYSLIHHRPSPLPRLRYTVESREQ